MRETKSNIRRMYVDTINRLLSFDEGSHSAVAIRRGLGEGNDIERSLCVTRSGYTLIATDD